MRDGTSQTTHRCEELARGTEGPVVTQREVTGTLLGASVLAVAWIGFAGPEGAPGVSGGVLVPIPMVEPVTLTLLGIGLAIAGRRFRTRKR